FGQRRNHLEHITDDPIIGHLEDRRVLVLVDGDDRLRGAHAGEVLHGAGDAYGDVKLRTDETSRLSYLIAVWAPAIVGNGARGSDRRIAERRGEIFDKLEVLRRLEAAAAGDDNGCFGEIQLASATFARLKHFYSCRARIDGRLSILDASRLGVLRGSNDVWTHRDHSRRSGDGDGGDHLADVHWMPDDDRIAVDFNRQNIGDDAGAQSGCHSWRQISALSRRTEDSGAVPAGFDAIGRRRGGDFRIVIGEPSVLDDDHDIGTVRANLGCLGGNSRRTEYERVNLGAEFVG